MDLKSLEAVNGMQTVFLKTNEAEIVKRLRNQLVHTGVGGLDKDVLENVKKEVDLNRFTNGAIIALACAVLLHYLQKEQRK